MKRCIFHVDVNSAFLSWSAVKRLKENPAALDLRTVPSAVGGDVKTRHGVITANSLPAKKLGIRTGEPVITALRKCPGLILVPADFETYRACSGAFIAILKKYARAVEQVSIDEAFLDMTGLESRFPAVSAETSAAGEPQKLLNPRGAASRAGTRAAGPDGAPLTFPLNAAYLIKNEIRDTLHFSVNVGISENKFLAKMASDFEKPDKVHTLWPAEIPEKLWPLPIGSMYGCGRSTSARLSSYGIRTIGDAARTSPEILRSILGEKSGESIWRSANGLNDSPVNGTPEEAKSYSNETTTSEDITRGNFREKLPPLLEDLSQSVAFRMQQDKVRALTVGVIVKTGAFRRHTRQLTIERPTNSAAEILRTATRLMDELLLGTGGHPGLFDAGEVLRLVGVSAQNLRGAANGSFEQLSLFDWAAGLPPAPDSAAPDARSAAGIAAALEVSAAAEDSEPPRIPAAPDASRQRKLSRMMQELDEKFGRGAVRRGSEVLSGDGPADGPSRQ